MKTLLLLATIFATVTACSKAPSKISSYNVFPGQSLVLDSAFLRKEKDYEILTVIGHWTGGSPADDYRVSVNFAHPYSLRPPELRSWYHQGPADKVSDGQYPARFEIKGPLPANPVPLLITLTPKLENQKKIEIPITVANFSVVNNTTKQEVPAGP